MKESKLLKWPWKREKRNSSPENPAVPVSAPDFIERMGWQDIVGTVASEPVTVETAMGVPAYWCGVNFLSGTVAGLPIGVYQKTKDGRKKIDGGISDVLGAAINDETTSFEWRKHGMDEVLTEGRWLTYIERDRAGLPVNLWPLEIVYTVPKRINGRRVYTYTGGGQSVDYPAADVIDIHGMLRRDGVTHHRPLFLHREVLAQAIAVMKYGSRFFLNGGVPPFTVSGPIKTAAGVDRAGKDMTKAVADAAAARQVALGLPDGHTITPLGFDPTKMQMVEMRKFLIEEIARILGLPKVFLMDLTQGTFSNTEQQDLQLVKHYIKRWIEQIEEQLNLKLFGRGSPFYVRFNLDGLMRGDFLSRMQGLAMGIQNGLIKPNEGRALDEREADPDGNQLMVQGGTFSLRNAILNQQPKAAPNADPVKA